MFRRKVLQGICSVLSFASFIIAVDHIVFFLIFTYVHESGVMTERVLSEVQVAEIRFL